MTECIEPGLIKEGDLIAYVDRDADARIRAHIDRCPACKRRVAELRETSLALLTVMYRATCPSGKALVEHHQGLLSAAETLRVAAHVRSCPHCSRELAEIPKEQDSLVTMVLTTIQKAARVIEASLTIHPQSRLADVRGADRIEQRSYHADDLDVVIDFQLVEGGQEGAIVGAVVQAEAVTGGRAWLFQDGEKPTSTPVDELGSFVFEGVVPGKHDVALEMGDQALLLREVVDSE